MKKIGKIVLLSTSLVFSGAVTPYTPWKAEAVSILKLAYISYQTTGNVYMRQGPGTKNQIIMLIPKSTAVIAFEQTGNWYHLTYQSMVKGKKVTKTGWVSGSYLKKVVTAKAPAISSQQFIQTMFQTAESLNLRSGAGTTYKSLLTIPKGTVISSSEKIGSWYKTVYSYTLNGKTVKTTGWVIGTYLKEYYQSHTITNAYYFTIGTVSLYPTADTKNRAVYSVQEGNGFNSVYQVTNSIGETWYQITYNGKKLYVNSRNVRKSVPQTFAPADYQANVDTYLYDSVGKIFTKILQIPKETFLSINQKIGDWYAVTINGKKGYVYDGDVTKYSQPTEKNLDAPADFIAVTDGVLRIYPDDASNLLSSIPKGTKLTPTDITENGWYKVVYNGVTGYINGTSLQKVADNPPVNPEVPFSQATYLILADLNLRQTSDTSSTRLAVIPKGTIVIPTSKTSDNWYKVSYGGNTGYVYGTYLEQVITGDPMGNRDSYQFIDLRTQSPVTAAQINNYIAGYVKLTGKTSILAGKGQVFIDAGKKYGVNALYLAAHAIHESAYGTSPISIGKNNLFGFGAYDAAPYMSAYRFESVDDCIYYIASEIKSTYLNPLSWKYQGPYLGFSTKSMSNTRIDENSEGMNFYYASDPNWGKAIAQHMENILHYDKAYYANANADTIIPARPDVPVGSDLFPQGIVAISKDSSIGIPKGNSFFVLEKTNDFRLRVNYAGKEFWINNIKFSSYSNYLSVLNLGRVTIDQLNVRQDPSTAKAPIAVLSLNDLVQIVLQKDGSLVMDPNKSWYEVVLPNGTTGWVSSAYIYSRDFK